MKKKQDDNSILLDQTQRTYDFLSGAFSNSDCTGLSPSGMNTDEQAEGYKELYCMNPSKTPGLANTRITNKKSK